MEPNPDLHVQVGQTMPIMGVIEDGSWLKDDLDSDEYPIRTYRPPHHGLEFTTYDDPRFPSEIVEAYRVRVNNSPGPYVDGSIIFAAPSHIIGYKEGDHVLIILDDRAKDLVSWTIRQVAMRDGEVWYEPILSNEPAFQYSDSVRPPHILTNVRGVVIGSIQRRKVNELDIGSRRHLEGFSGRGGSAEGPLRRYGKPTHDDKGRGER